MGSVNNWRICKNCNYIMMSNKETQEKSKIKTEATLGERAEKRIREIISEELKKRGIE